MLPLVVKPSEDGSLPFANGDYIFLPDIRSAVENADPVIRALRIDPVNGTAGAFEMTLGDLTDDERRIILDGCLINYYRAGRQ